MTQRNDDMHLAISIFVLLAVWRWGDWRNWQKYHTTMLYFALGNLVYNFLSANHFLWKLNPDFLTTHSVTEMLYTFIVFPGTALLFISNYPEKAKLWKQAGYCFLWVALYASVEALYVVHDRIIYQYGWHLGWSTFFDCTMFPMLRLFFLRPLLAYSISFPMAIFWVWLFDVPYDIPIEDR